ncbi:MAG TPA: dipeptidase [Chitinophagaceae bacterium]
MLTPRAIPANPVSPKMMEDYKTFLRFPSIASDPAHTSDVGHCAKWLAKKMKEAGLSTVKIISTPGHPIIYGEQKTDPSNKTILFYGHYEVQPGGPFAKWKSPPCNPVTRDNYIYARGASDDKGQVWIQLKAIEYMLKRKDQYRINIKCIYEGEEETGSKNLGPFIKTNRNLLQSDAVIVSDSKMLGADQPAITYSLRGSFNAALTITNGGKELHSGTYGGMVYDPSSVMSKLLAGMHDSTGKIIVPGFYNQVVPIKNNERNFMQKSGPPDESLLADSGATSSHGEPGFSNYERTTIRPSIVITTLIAGHTGAGFNNSVSSTATAKMNVRLAGGQRPIDAARQIRSYIQHNLPPSIRYKLRFSSPVDPVATGRKHPYMMAAAKAYTQVFKRPVTFLRSGGTIPIVSLMQKEMGVPVVLMGFALGSDNMHAPNERFYLPNLDRGIQTIIEFARQVSKHSTKPINGHAYNR